MGSPRSKVEIKGFEAKYYDILMDVLTFGAYKKTMEKAIELMGINENDKILDLGAGTGRNACIMRKYIKDQGEIVGLDISNIMIEKSKKRCKNYDNVRFEKARIEEELPYREYFDKVFISFVLHGFEQEDREKILKNIYTSLKPKGELFILDYTHAHPREVQGIYKVFLTRLECPLAYEFVVLDQEAFLKEFGFSIFSYNYFFYKRVNLLKAIKN